MIRFSSFTPRMWLILVHDLLATAAAVVASFFIRFEEGGLAEAPLGVLVRAAVPLPGLAEVTPRGVAAAAAGVALAGGGTFSSWPMCRLAGLTSLL